MKIIICVSFLCLALCACGHSPKIKKTSSQVKILEYGFEIVIQEKSNPNLEAEKMVYIEKCPGINSCNKKDNERISISYEEFIARVKVNLRKERERNILDRQEDYLEKGLADLKFEKQLMEHEKKIIRQPAQDVVFQSKLRRLSGDEDSTSSDLIPLDAKIAQYESDLQFIAQMKTYEFDLDKSADRLIQWVEKGRWSHYSKEVQQDHFWKLLQKIGFQISQKHQGA